MGNMKLSRDKINICRARMNVILNQREVSVISVGRLAGALGCDVTELIKD